MPRTRKAQRQVPPIRYKVPLLKDRRQSIILRGFLPPGCKRACRDVIDVAFAQMGAYLTGKRQLPVIRRGL